MAFTTFRDGVTMNSLSTQTITCKLPLRLRSLLCSLSLPSPGTGFSCAVGVAVAAGFVSAASASPSNIAFVDSATYAPALEWGNVELGSKSVAALTLTLKIKSKQTALAFARKTLKHACTTVVSSSEVSKTTA